MRLSIFATIATALVFQAVPALTQTAATAGPPKCALGCIMELVPAACGSLSNATCVCNDQILAPKLTACVSTKCSKRDTLAAKKYSDVSCKRPVNDRTTEVIVSTPVFGALAVLVFALRVLARGVVGWQSWGWDDWIMVPCVLLSIPMSVLSSILANYGLGKDIWMVDNYDNITELLYLYFYDEIIYLAIPPLTKISILVFYLRIFPRKEMRKWVYVLIGGNVLYFIVFEVITIFQCTPIDGAWRHWDGEYEATCRSLNLQAWIAAAVCLVLDIATIILPLPELWALSMSTKKKVQVLSMFSVGFFVSLVAIIRLQYILQFAQSSNITMDFVDIGIWSTIEVNVGIICACMPAMRVLLSRIMPKAFGSSVKPTYGGQGGAGGGNSSSMGLSSMGGLSTHQVAGGATTSSNGIKVKSEYTVRSKQRDESTFVELQPLDSDDNDDTREILVGNRTGANNTIASAGGSMRSGGVREKSSHKEFGRGV